MAASKISEKPLPKTKLTMPKETAPKRVDGIRKPAPSSFGTKTVAPKVGQPITRKTRGSAIEVPKPVKPKVVKK